ncbi:MAG: hypothetical protein H6703_12020 [Myxococcales bacterium]|nr:hypothetical protein [Myxococcales bacterium]
MQGEGDAAGEAGRRGVALTGALGLGGGGGERAALGEERAAAGGERVVAGVEEVVPGGERVDVGGRARIERAVGGGREEGGALLDLGELDLDLGEPRRAGLRRVIVGRDRRRVAAGQQPAGLAHRADGARRGADPQRVAGVQERQVDDLDRPRPRLADPHHQRAVAVQAHPLDCRPHRSPPPSARARPLRQRRIGRLARSRVMFFWCASRVPPPISMSLASRHRRST